MCIRDRGKAREQEEPDKEGRLFSSRDAGDYRRIIRRLRHGQGAPGGDRRQHQRHGKYRPCREIGEPVMQKCPGIHGWPEMPRYTMMRMYSAMDISNMTGHDAAFITMILFGSRFLDFR